MSKSNVYSRLHSLFKSNKPPAKIPTVTNKLAKPQSQQFPPLKKLLNEPNLEKMAHLLKQRAARSVRFRDHNSAYDFAIGRLVVAERFSLIHDILEFHKGFEEISREGFVIRLITLYGKAGMFDHARQLFDEMPQLNCTRTVKSVNALLKAGVKSKRFSDVCQIYRNIPAELSIELDCISYNTVIHGFCEMGLLDDALLILEEVKEKGLIPNVFIFNTLLDAFYRERGYEDGERIWDMMVEHNVDRNIRSYNLKMQAMFKEGEIQKAVDLFGSLEEKGFKLDLDSFNVLIEGFCNMGNIEEAKRLYISLLKSGDAPNRITFSILAPKFCDIGDYDLAFDLCKNMFNRQLVVDEALLQLVVIALVKGSKTKEAKELVQLGKSNPYVQYNLVFPTDEELVA